MHQLHQTTSGSGLLPFCGCTFVWLRSDIVLSTSISAAPPRNTKHQTVISSVCAALCFISQPMWAVSQSDSCELRFLHRTGRPIGSDPKSPTLRDLLLLSGPSLLKQSVFLRSENAVNNPPDVSRPASSHAGRLYSHKWIWLLRLGEAGRHAVFSPTAQSVIDFANENNSSLFG